MADSCNYVDFSPTPYICTAENKVPINFRSGADWQGKGFWSAVPDLSHDQLPSWAHACACCFEILWKKNFNERRIISAQKLKTSVVGSSKSGATTSSGKSHGVRSSSSGATAQDVWKFLKRHTVDLEPSKESPAIFNYAVGSSIDLVKAMKTVRERPIVAAIRVGRDFARLKNEIYGGPIYGINHAEFRHLRKEYVVLIGFGWDRTIDRYYWLVLGCYGSDWGDGGVGKVYMDVMMRKRENDPNSWEYLIYDISWPSLTRKENWMKCKDC